MISIKKNYRVLVHGLQSSDSFPPPCFVYESPRSAVSLCEHWNSAKYHVPHLEVINKMDLLFFSYHTLKFCMLLFMTCFWNPMLNLNPSSILLLIKQYCTKNFSFLALKISHHNQKFLNKMSLICIWFILSTKAKIKLHVAYIKFGWFFQGQ